MAKLLDLTVYGPGHISNILQVDASVYAKAFVTDGGENTQVVRGDGTLASISSLSVGNADTVDNKHASDFASSTHSHSYLPLSGGTMTGTPYIYFPASVNNTALTDSTPTGLTYGRLQSYGTMTICGDTDGSTTEYVNITAGYSIANATAANGLSIGYSTLKWKGNTIWHAGNDGHGSGLDADTVDGVHLSSIIYAPTPGSVATGTSEETGKSSDVTRTSFWRDNNIGRIGLTVLHSDSAGYGWTINAGYSGTRFYTNIKTNGTWNSTEQTIAFLSDIPTVTNYYWANVKVSSSSSTTTSPTFASATSNTFYGKANGVMLYWGPANEYWLGSNTTTDYYLWSSNSTAALRLGTNNAERLRITVGGDVGIGTTAPTHKLHVAGSAKVGGNLLVGADASTNYIAFYGTTGDNPGSFNHTYIGENIWGTPESSELVLFKGNDIGTTATAVSSSGADRIRYIGGAHLFQIYKSALSGTFDSVCKSTVPVNMLAIHQESIETYASLYVGGSLNVNGGSDLNLRASSSSNTDPGDLVFANSSGTELARLWKPSVNDLYVRFGSSDSSKTILHSGNFTTHLNSTYVNVTGDTMTGALTLPANGLIVNSAGGDTAKRVIKAYGSATSNSGVYYLNFGDNPASGNCGEIGFTYVGSGSTSNKIAMGFYGGNYLTYYYNGSNPGTLTVGTTSNYHTVLTSGNTYVTGGYGVINGTTITQVANADTLDGEHGSRYTRALGSPNNVTFVVGGNADTYYPVVITSVSDYYPMQFVNISRTYSETAPDTWNTATHRGGLTLTLLWNGSRYWDGNSAGSACFCVYKNETYSTMVGGLGNAVSGKVVWLRGGGAHYHLHSMNGTSASATVYTSTYTDSAGQAFAPTTSPAGVSVRWPGYAQGADYATSAGNADTVDGQHFSYSNSSNSPTYLWATNSNGSNFLAARGSISVNYANSAGNADTLDGYHYNSFAWASHSHSTLETYFKFVSSDVTEAAVNLATSTTAHTMTFYRNGISIPYQMNDSNDGGLLRVRGTTESNVIYEMATWDDSGAGETIQFNYYPTTSAATPTYSVSVPKKSGTIALTSDIPSSLPANGGNADTVDNKHASDFAAANCGVWPTRSFTKSLAPTTSWQDTGITTNDLSDGEGAYLIFLNPNHSNGNDGWVPRYAGLFSNMSGTNGAQTEEIILQASSHASYKRLFLRFINTANTLGYRKLQIRAVSNYTASYSMVFNIRRIV